ncbi:MAG: ketopantoate reductase family protein [Oliverpabstia sp.]
MEFNKVAIIGAGAIGSYFIVGLSEKLGENLYVVAEGERRERLAENGIIVNGRKIHLHVKTAEEAYGADLLIIAVKYGALQESLPLIEKIVDEHTVVMSLLNGVESEDIIGERIGMNHMVYSFMKIASERIGNQITFDSDVTLGVFFGEKDGSISERILAIQTLLEDTDVHYHVCENIERDIWRKYALNISKNIPQAIINCGVGAYTESEHMAYISERMKEEVIQVAATKGIDIRDEKNSNGNKSEASPDSRFSTLQDLDAKRQTEIEMFSGTLIRMGKALGVETPFNEFAYHAIKSLEEKNCGKIK